MEDWVKDYSAKVAELKAQLGQKYICHPANQVKRKDGKTYGVQHEKDNVAQIARRRVKAV